jgi:dTMP kinase
MDLFCQWLAEQGHQVVTCRDPGSTSLGERIREIVLASDDDTTPITSRSEMLLYMAARAQLVEEVIRPALEAGQTLVSDRYLLANVVYQGHAGGLDVPTIRTVGQVATDGVDPDCTFLLDMPPTQAWQRIDRKLDRIESRGLEYRERVRDGFLTEARLSGLSIHVVDAARPIDAVQQELRDIALDML